MRPRPRLMISAIVGVLLAMAGAAGAAAPFPPFTQPVVDAAGLVADATQRQVDAELIDYEARSGNQIAVAVVNTTGNQSIEDYAIDLARSWGVGQADKDSGILLVIAYRDRKLRIEVGRGLEGELTDLQSGRIIRERLVPLLKRGDVAAAVVQGTQAIRLELGDTQVGALPPALGESGRGASGAWLYIAGLLGFGALTLLGSRRRGGRGGRGGGAGEAIVWGAALAALSGLGGHGRRGGFGGGGGGGFGGGGASGDW